MIAAREGPAAGRRRWRRSSGGRAGHRWSVTVAVLAAALSVACGALRVSAQESPERLVAPAGPRSPEEQRRAFHLPPGFRIELVAAEPVVSKPINLNFDGAGRLLVTGSVEYPLPAPPGRTPCDRLVALSDRDGDEHFETAETWIEGLNIPVGVTLTAAGLMVYSIPTIDLWHDQDGDGRFEKRTPAYGQFGFQDTHGMPNGFTWWLDGWVYGCQGQTNRSTIRQRDGGTLVLQGGCTFRMRPDGSHLERYSYGQVNPFGLCFDPWGNVYTADSNSRPGSLVLPGAWYPTLSRTDDGLGYGPTIMDHFHGSTGIAGIAYYDALQFPEPYRHTLFIGNPVTGRVNHDRIEFSGSTARAVELPDFLTCDDPWFRPVDLQVGPDGALYIADFYNRIIAHSLVPLDDAKRDHQRGRIWRVVYEGDSKASLEERITWPVAGASIDQLWDDLAASNMLIRRWATHEMVHRIGRPAVAFVRQKLRSGTVPRQRVHSIWVLLRLNSLDGELMAALAADPAVEVRTHLMHALGELPDWRFQSPAVQALAYKALKDDGKPARAAVQSLARHPHPAFVSHLLELLKRCKDDDPMLRHAARIALRNCLATPGILAEAAEAYREDRIARRWLADVAPGIPTPAAAEYLLDYLKGATVALDDLQRWLYHAARYASDGTLNGVYEYARSLRMAETDRQQTVLRALFEAAMDRDVDLPDDVRAWGRDCVIGLLTDSDEQAVYDGLELAWDLQTVETARQLVDLMEDADRDLSLRSFAMDVLASVDGPRQVDRFERILGDVEQPPELRGKAAEVLGKLVANRRPELLQRHLKTAPARVARDLARAMTWSVAGSQMLFDYLEHGAGDPTLLLDPVVDDHLRNANPPNWAERRERLLGQTASSQNALAWKVQSYRQRRQQHEPSEEHGQQLFDKHCAVCHQLGGQGEQVGPSLDGIGLRGVDRLLEDVLLPNQNVDPAYRRSTLILRDGRILSGFVLRQEAGTVILVDSTGKQMRVPRREIEERVSGRLSPMPDNLSDTLSEEDLLDVIAFLLTARQEPTDAEP